MFTFINVNALAIIYLTKETLFFRPISEVHEQLCWFHVYIHNTTKGTLCLLRDTIIQ